MNYRKNMIKKLLFICISITYIFSSCACNGDGGKTDEIQGAKVNKVQIEGNLIEYASFIGVNNYKSGYYVNISNPWSNKSLGEFYLYPDSLMLPEELNDKTVIRTPVKNVIAYSSTQWSVFIKLGEIDRVKGVLEGSYSTNPEMRQQLWRGTIKDVGTETNLNTELAIMIQPDVILYTPYSTVPKNEIGELTDAVMFPFADYLENHPLGRAEWMKMIGYLTCREKDTDKWFAEIVTRYNTLKSVCENVKYRPTVFSDLPFEGQWYLPGGESYIAQIFHDAGAKYIWSDNSSTASLPVDAETVLNKAYDADFWRIMNSTNSPYSYRRLASENEIYTYFKAYQNRNILVCDIRESGYFEQSEYEPDILLNDFVYAFHPELVDKNYKPKYFYRLTNEK